MEIADIKNAYFLGIGGIGMSAIARYFNELGIRVSGYDLHKSSLTETLVSEGMKIHYQEDVSLIPKDIDIVVYTPAIPESNKEWKYLKTVSVPIVKRSQVLGLISNASKTIAVAGTHGKTSTTTLLAFLMHHLGMNPVCFLGGIAKNFDSNYVSGEEWTIVEADEFDRSFHNLSPDIALITSMDPDHLDVYGSYESMKNGFWTFVRKLKPGGTLLIHDSLESELPKDVKSELEYKNVQVLSYGPKGKNGRYNIGVTKPWLSNWSFETDDMSTDISWAFPGVHNVENATAAFLILQVLGLDLTVASKLMSNYKGVRRRFELVAKSDTCVLIDDYAHHPEELNACINGVKAMYPQERITGIFQPHLFSRTLDHYLGFAKALNALDEAIVLPIYPAREEPIKGVNSAMIVEAMEEGKGIVVNHDELKKVLEKTPKEVIITLGAGNLEKHHPMIEQLFFE